MEGVQRPGRKFVRYVPGMFSLVTVPVMLVLFTWLRLAQRPHYHTMEVNWYNEAYFSRMKWFHKPPRRQYLHITLTGKEGSDNVRIAFGELYIREVYANRDTLHGVDFHFSEHSKYAAFVRVLDMANINDIRYYMASDDGIKMYYNGNERAEQPPKPLGYL